MDLEKYIQYPLIYMRPLRATLMDLVYAKKLKGKKMKNVVLMIPC